MQTPTDLKRNEYNTNIVINSSGATVEIRNLFQSRSAFLVCGGPSFALADKTKLRLPGVLTMGVNNSVRTFRPNMWVALDPAHCFIRSVFLDPTILKFFHYGRRNDRIFNSDTWKWEESLVKECPGTLFYNAISKLDYSKFFSEPVCSSGQDRDKGGAMSVMFVAFRLLHYLGVRRVFLLGADFNMKPESCYHFDQKKDATRCAIQNQNFEALNRFFAQLRPVFDGEGFNVLNCSPNSSLSAFDKMDFDTAIQEVQKEFGVDTTSERSCGLYDSLVSSDPQYKKPEYIPPVISCKEVPKNKFWKGGNQIPAKAHFIFLGGPLPRFVSEFVGQFRKNNPSFDVVVHQTIPSYIPIKWHQHILKQGSHAIRSDWVRPWIIQKEGGFYLDTDNWTFRSFSELLGYSNVFMGIGKNRANNAVFGESAGGPATKEIIHRLEEHHFVKGNPEIIEAGTNYKWPKLYNAGPAIYSIACQESPELFNLVPAHWFQCSWGGEERAKYVRANQTELMGLFSKLKNTIDGVLPFSLHCGSDVDRTVFPDVGGTSSIRPIGRADSILKRIDLCSETIGVEVGVMQGRMSAELLAFAPKLKLSMIDSWRSAERNSPYYKTGDSAAKMSDAEMLKAKDKAVAATDFAKNRRTIIHAESKEAVRLFADRSQDFVFIDSDHSYEGVVDAISEWEPKVRPGGWLCGHDYNSPLKNLIGVDYAVNEFVTKRMLRLETDADNTWFVRIP